MAKNSANAAAKWLASMQSVGTQTAYKDGVSNVSVSPMQKAADAEQQYLQGVQDAVASGRRTQALLAVPLSTWKDAATNKGAPRLASGATAATGKVQAHFQKWGPIYQQISAQVAAMPSGGVANAMARVQATIVALKQAAGKSTA